MRWTMTCYCRTEERITLYSRSRHRRHRQGRQRHEGRCRSAGSDLAIRQRARTCDRNAVGIQHGSRLKHIVRAPQLPHPFREVRIEVAVENGIANYLISIASAAVNDFSRKCETWSECLTIEVSRIVVIRCL